MTRLSRLLVLTAAGLVVAAPGASAAELVAPDSPRWLIEANESRVEEYLGRQALYLKGGMATLADVEILDGAIEFDVAFTGERGFMGGVWRMADADNFELFYVRPHQSGNPDANQYTPTFNGLTAWQLYHGPGYGAPVGYTSERWLRVRIVFAGGRGEVYLDSDEPVLVMHELKHEPRAGGVGLSVGNFAPAWFSNFRYEAIDRPELRGTPAEPAAPPEGVVSEWSVSSSFGEATLDGETYLGDSADVGLEWTTLAAESSGITNLARVATFGPDRNTVFARFAVDSESEQALPLRFGYSDRVRVYCNGRLLYRGSNAYRSRDYRYLGTIGLFDEVLLPLEEGRNEVRLAVSESFGGWGVVAALPDRSGLRIADP